MFGMALTAIVLGVSLASCSKDENTDSGDKSSEKKLMKIVTVDESGNEIGLRFNYDNNGKLNKVQFNNAEDGPNLRTYKFSWDGNVINFKKPESQDTFKFTIDNQFIRSYEDGSISHSYLYFADRLDKIDKGTDSFGKPAYISTIWNEDKLVDTNDASEMGLYVAHPELIGVRTSQLPTTITTTDKWGDSESENISYEFDKDGYISKILWEDDYSLNLIWE